MRGRKMTRGDRGLQGGVAHGEVEISALKPAPFTFSFPVLVLVPVHVHAPLPALS